MPSRAEVTHYKPTTIHVRLGTMMTLSKVQQPIDKIHAGEEAIGVLNMSYSPELVEILA